MLSITRSQIGYTSRGGETQDITEMNIEEALKTFDQMKESSGAPIGKWEYSLYGEDTNGDPVLLDCFFSNEKNLEDTFH